MAEEARLSARMAELMRDNDAPAEQFERLGLAVEETCVGVVGDRVASLDFAGAFGDEDRSNGEWGVLWGSCSVLEKLQLQIQR